MDKIIEKKSNVDKAVHELLCVWTEIESYNYNDIDKLNKQFNLSIDELNKKNDILNKANMKLIDEITQKDKIIITDKKIICDYEKQINSLCVNEVKEEDNKWYYNFLKLWYKKSGVPMLLNTSFNDREPICETPDHAINCFLRTDIDHLYFYDYKILLSKL